MARVRSEHKHPLDGSACLLLAGEEVQEFPGPQDGDRADSFQVKEILVAGDKAVDPRNMGCGGKRCVLWISYSVAPSVDLCAVLPPGEQLASAEDRLKELERTQQSRMVSERFLDDRVDLFHHLLGEHENNLAHERLQEKLSLVPSEEEP
jgi:hypothetical protein